MPKSYADLLREARAQIREVSPQEVDALPAGAATIIDVREASEWEQGHLPGARHISKTYIEQQIEGVVPDRDAPVVLYCAGGVRSLFAAQTLADMGYTDVASMSSGFQGWKSAGPRVRDADRPDRRAEAALQPPPAHPRGRGRRPGEAARLEGAAHRRRRPRLAGLAVPRRRGRRDDRHRRLRHRRCQQPPAPDRPHDRPGRGAQGRIREEVDQRAQPGGQGRRPRGDARRGQRRADHRRLRRHPRRHRHVRDALHPQRRRGRGRHPGRPRQRLPVRGPADDLRPVRGSVLSLPLSRPRRRRSSRPAAPWPASSASCPGSSACSRPTRRSRSCSGSASTLAGRLLLFDALETEFTELKLRRDPACPVCSDAAVEARAAGSAVHRRWSGSTPRS